jgi:GNAT superfamily N-acetyltransferase
VAASSPNPRVDRVRCTLGRETVRWHSRPVAFVSIRTAVPGDLPALRRVFRRASLSNDGDRAILLANPTALELPDGNVIEGRTRVAMSSDGTVVGFATGVRQTDSALELEDLFVDPAHRRRGIARALLADLAASARRDGITHIEVTANPHADRFYRDVGFAAVGHADTEFGTGARMRLEISAK